MSKPKVGTRWLEYDPHVYDSISEPIKFLMKPSSIYHVNEGDQLVLPCMAFGSPPPRIKWFKVGRTIAVCSLITVDVLSELGGVEGCQWQFNLGLDR